MLDAVALKLSKFGGLSAMRRARDLTVHLGAEICAECTWGSDIVTAASLHFAASTPQGSLLNTCIFPPMWAGALRRTAPRVKMAASIRPKALASVSPLTSASLAPPFLELD